MRDMAHGPQHTATASSARAMLVYDAVFGGAIAVEPMVGYVGTIPPDVMIPVETIRSILSGQADIDTNGDIYDCAALSVAIVTEAVIH